MKSIREELEDIVNEEREYKILVRKYEDYYYLEEFHDWHDKWFNKRLKDVGVPDWLVERIWSFIYDEEREDNGWLTPVINEIVLSGLVNIKDEIHFTDDDIDVVIDGMQCDPVTGKKWVDDPND